MRSNVLFLAIGLFIADSALAGPCKPRSSASEEVTVTSDATSETATTVLATSTDVLSETVTTAVTPATTTAVDTTLGSTTSEAETSTAIATTAVDTTTVAETTTVADTTTIAETTTTAPAPIATWSLRVSGSPINGATAQGNDQSGTLLIFNPNFSGVRARTYAIEPSTGRLQDTDTGRYVCAYYGYTPITSVPAMVSNCWNDGQNGNDKTYNYITCQVVNGLLSCTAPRGTCVRDPRTFRETCTTVAGVLDKFYYQWRVSGGDYWFIGSGSENPAGYTSIDVAAIKV